MHEQNICRFVPHDMGDRSVHTVHFVYETEQQPYRGLRLESVYKMYFVCHGEGRLHTQGEVRPLRKGDVFFSFPAEPFCVEAVDDLRYMYIGFLGSRGLMLLDKLGINPAHCLFSDCADVGPIWEKSISAHPDLSDVASESVLLYTFSYLGTRKLNLQPRDRQGGDTVSIIKKYIDDHFSDPSFSLDSLGRELKYNKKYLSTVFKKHMGVGIVEYLNTVRIQHACTMIRQGFSSVSDVALRCGYADPQYFSKVFKRQISLSPRAYMDAVRRDGGE